MVTLQTTSEISCPGPTWAENTAYVIAAGMTDDLTTIVLRAIERAPQWVRRDLESKDRVVRIQAEESLAAMIADALRRIDEPSI
jgi:hypothetical protein